MNTNFSVRFQIVRENQDNRMPGIFDNNTTIEMSGPSLGVFNSNRVVNPFLLLDSMMTPSPSPSDNSSSSVLLGNLFDLFPIEQQQTGNIMDMFLNQSLQQDQPHVEKATNDMIKQLGSYNRIKDDDSLIGTECIICSDCYKKDEGVRELPCGHVFHKKCIDRWFKEGSVYCPICRKNPFEEKQEEEKTGSDS